MSNSRFTAKDLENEIRTINEKLAGSGSVYFYKINSAYGDTQIHLHMMHGNGSSNNRGSIEMGTPRDCDKTMASDHYNWISQVNKYEKPTRKAAKAILAPFINFTIDSARLSHNQLILLAVWAKLTGYKKSPTSTRSVGSAFFIHLQNKVEI